MRCAWLAALVVVLVAVPARPARAQDLIRGEVTPLDRSAVQLVVDSRQPLGQIGDPEAGPSYRLRGWAADRHAPSGPGIRQLVAYLDGPSGHGRLLGWARYGLARPDVALAYNDPALAPCGFELTWRVADLPSQVEPIRSYTLYVYLDTAAGWVLAQVPVALALWADDGQDP